MGYCGYQEELLHHHKCPTTSYSITACSVFRCTGGFVIALIPNGKGVRMMLSTEYRESIERRFHAFCKAVLHNEACNYYRERKHRTQREISFGYLQENTSFAPHSVDEYFVLQVDCLCSQRADGYYWQREVSKSLVVPIGASAGNYPYALLSAIKR